MLIDDERKNKMKNKLKTMHESYGDYSDHLACPNCGLCINCGDCECEDKEGYNIAFCGDGL
jgi:hypothetical protein